MHTNSMDEALALPSEHAVTVALRTQQIIAEESGVVNTIDPLGGSYFVEALTNKMEEQTYEYFDRIEALGGVLPAIERGFFQTCGLGEASRYKRLDIRLVAAASRNRPTHTFSSAGTEKSSRPEVCYDVRISGS